MLKDIWKGHSMFNMVTVGEKKKKMKKKKRKKTQQQ